MNPYHCPLCDEEIDPARAEDENYSRPLGTPEGPRRAHRECLLRTVALEVDAWVHAHKVDTDLPCSDEIEREEESRT